jgi:hypothetical protein
MKLNQVRPETKWSIIVTVLFVVLVILPTIPRNIIGTGQRNPMKLLNNKDLMSKMPDVLQRLSVQVPDPVKPEEEVVKKPAVPEKSVAGSGNNGGENGVPPLELSFSESILDKVVDKFGFKVVVFLESTSDPVFLISGSKLSKIDKDYFIDNGLSARIRRVDVTRYRQHLNKAAEYLKTDPGNLFVALAIESNKENVFVNAQKNAADKAGVSLNKVSRMVGQYRVTGGEVRICITQIELKNGQVLGI